MGLAAAAFGLMLLLLGLGGCEREQKAIQEDLPAARSTKALADVRQIAAAVRLYQATFGELPPSLEALTEAQTVGGATGGPFLATIPAPPAGWSPYRYTIQGSGRFAVTSTGGAGTVTAP